MAGYRNRGYAGLDQWTAPAGAPPASIMTDSTSPRTITGESGELGGKARLQARANVDQQRGEVFGEAVNRAEARARRGSMAPCRQLPILVTGQLNPRYAITRKSSVTRISSLRSRPYTLMLSGVQCPSVRLPGSSHSYRLRRQRVLLAPRTWPSADCFECRWRNCRLVVGPVPTHLGECERNRRGLLIHDPLAHSPFELYSVMRCASGVVA